MSNDFPKEPSAPSSSIDEQSTPETPYQDEPNIAKSITRKVVLFKNGQCMVVRHLDGNVTENGDFLWTDELPQNAVLGTVWFLPIDENTKLLSTDCQWVETIERSEHEVSCTSYLELLSENIGHPCTITLPPWNPGAKIKTQRVINGIVKSVLHITGKDSNIPVSFNQNPQLQPMVPNEFYDEQMVYANEARQENFAPQTTNSFQPSQSPRRRLPNRKNKSKAPVERRRRAGFLHEYHHKSANSKATKFVQVYRASPNISKKSEKIEYSDSPVANFCVVTTEKGDQVIRISEIYTLAISNMKTTRTQEKTVTSQKKRLSLNFAPNPASTYRSCALIYFTNGMSWTPTYRLELNPEDVSNKKSASTSSKSSTTQKPTSTTEVDENIESSSWFGFGSKSTTFSTTENTKASKDHQNALKNIPNSKAKLSLQAEVLNALENLENVDLDFVIGIPSFDFQNMISPMTLETDIANSIKTVFPDIFKATTKGAQYVYNSSMPQQPQQNNYSSAPNPFSNAFQQYVPQIQKSSYQQQQQAVVSPQSHSFESTGVIDLAGGTDSSPDLFVYSIKNTTISKGARALVPLVKSLSELPFKDVYTWNLRLQTQNYTLSENQPSSPCTGDNESVIHHIDITNCHDYPWTTGPLFVIQHPQLPISQDLIKYTPSGQTARLKLATAVNIPARKHKDTEIQRKLKIERISGNYYSRVDRKVEFLVPNTHPFDINFEFTLKIGGKVIKATDATVQHKPYSSDPSLFSYGDSGGLNVISIVTIKKVIEAGKIYNPSIQLAYYSQTP